MEQVERIRQMEQQFEKALAATNELSAALDKYLKAQEAIQILSDYYGSDVWKQDFVDDESKRLSKDLKRGVLSEDAIWNLLADSHELNLCLQEVATKLLNTQTDE